MPSVLVFILFVLSGNVVVSFLMVGGGGAFGLGGAGPVEVFSPEKNLRNFLSQGCP
jgi:hypothetical protein